MGDSGWGVVFIGARREDRQVARSYAAERVSSTGTSEQSFYSGFATC